MVYHLPHASKWENGALALTYQWVRELSWGTSVNSRLRLLGMSSFPGSSQSFKWWCLLPKSAAFISDNWSCFLLPVFLITTPCLRYFSLVVYYCVHVVHCAFRTHYIWPVPMHGITTQRYLLKCCPSGLTLYWVAILWLCVFVAPTQYPVLCLPLPTRTYCRFTVVCPRHVYCVCSNFGLFSMCT